MQFKAICFFLLTLVSIFIGSARLRAQEVQVPVCDGIKVITPYLANGLDFFSAYPDFQQATLYKASDKTLVMEILYKQDGSIVKIRKPITREEADVLCVEIQANIIDKSDDGRDSDYDGRRKIIGSTMAYSLAYYAWALPAAFDATSASAITGSYLLIGSAGFFIPMLATENAVISRGMAKGYTFGCFLGIGHGLALGSLMAGDFSSNSILGVSVITSIGEGLGGLYYARKYKLSRAHMSTMGSLGVWGGLYGMGIPAMAESENTLAYAGSVLGLSALGIFAGDQLSKKYKPSDGDVTVTNAMGLLGGYFPVALVNTISGEDGSPAAYIGGAILGSAAGLTLGFMKTAKLNYTRTEGNLILLGEIAGGLFGAGLALVTGAEGPAAVWMVGGGALAGFLASDYVMLSKRKKDNKMGTGLSFDFNPMALQKIIKKESYRPVPGKPFFGGDLAKITLHL